MVCSIQHRASYKAIFLNQIPKSISLLCLRLMFQNTTPFILIIANAHRVAITTLRSTAASLLRKTSHLDISYYNLIPSRYHTMSGDQR